ncbi:MAG: hypothetical protein ACR2PF_13330 [Rhizobiaceae bacterium]
MTEASQYRDTGGSLTDAAAGLGSQTLAAFKPAWLEAFLGLILVAVLSLMALFAVLKPNPNWDSLAYFALALEKSGDTPAQIHAKAYDAIKKSASPGAFKQLTMDDAYRKRQYRDPDAFQSMLPMYAVKSGYIATLKQLSSFVGIANAAHAINFAALFAIAGVMLWWMRQGGFLQAIPFVLPVLFVLQTHEMIAGVMPDLPAAALLLAATWLLSQKRDWFAVPLLIAATTFRPDTLLFAFALCLAFAATRQKLLPVAIAFAACLAVHFLQTSAANHMGWWPHFWFSNVEYQQTMLGFDPDFSLVAYVKGLARGTSMSLAYFNWPFVGMALAAGWVLLARAGYRFEIRTIALLIAVILVIGGKFVTFPLPDDRIYMVFLITAAMLLASVWKPRLI